MQRVIRGDLGDQLIDRCGDGLRDARVLGDLGGELTHHLRAQCGELVDDVLLALLRGHGRPPSQASDFVLDGGRIGTFGWYGADGGGHILGRGSAAIASLAAFTCSLIKQKAESIGFDSKCCSHPVDGNDRIPLSRKAFSSATAGLTDSSRPLDSPLRMAAKACPGAPVVQARNSARFSLTSPLETEPFRKSIGAKPASRSSWRSASLALPRASIVSSTAAIVVVRPTSEVNDCRIASNVADESRSVWKSERIASSAIVWTGAVSIPRASPNASICMVAEASKASICGVLKTSASLICARISSSVAGINARIDSIRTRSGLTATGSRRAAI